MSKVKLTLEEMLVALIVDDLNFLCWAKTKDAPKGRNKPKSILKKLMGEDKPKDELMAFDSVEEFENYMNQLRNK